MAISKHIPNRPAACELCGRSMINLTQHHLIPRTRHRNKRVQKQFSRNDMLTRILWVCRPCHSHIHTVLSEKELAMHFNTRTALLQHPDILRFVEWIRKRPTGFKPR
jgi:predicted RNA-binding protein